MTRPSTPARRRALRLADLALLRTGRVSPDSPRRYPLIRFPWRERRALTNLAWNRSRP